MDLVELAARKNLVQDSVGSYSIGRGFLESFGVSF